MKVGTDGVLLGAWARLKPTDRRVLDIGTGTGVVALMAAQRTEGWCAQVVAVEIDSQSADEAKGNFEASPWAERLSLVQGAVQGLECAERFDHIVSNPPYFVDSLRSPNEGRSLARHTDSLTFDELMRSAERLLTDQGVLSVVLPADALSDITLAAARVGLFLVRRCDVCSKPTSAPIRVLLEFGRKAEPTEQSRLTIYDGKGGYTAEYVALTRDFYLKF